MDKPKLLCWKIHAHDNLDPCTMWPFLVSSLTVVPKRLPAIPVSSDVEDYLVFQHTCALTFQAEVHSSAADCLGNQVGFIHQLSCPEVCLSDYRKLPYWHTGSNWWLIPKHRRLPVAWYSKAAHLSVMPQTSAHSSSVTALKLDLYVHKSSICICTKAEERWSNSNPKTWDWTIVYSDTDCDSSTMENDSEVLVEKLTRSLCRRLQT